MLRSFMIFQKGRKKTFAAAKVDSVDYDGGEHSGCYVSVVQHKFKGTAAQVQRHCKFNEQNWWFGVS